MRHTRERARERWTRLSCVGVQLPTWNIPTLSKEMASAGVGSAAEGTMRRFQVVVAATLTQGIGKDNSLPWRLPGDLAHFKAITTGSTQPGKRNAVVRA